MSYKLVDLDGVLLDVFFTVDQEIESKKEIFEIESIQLSEGSECIEISEWFTDKKLSEIESQIKSGE